MTHRSPAGRRPAARLTSAAAGLVALSLVAAGCSAGSSTGSDSSTPRSTATIGKTDYNPQPYEKLKDGGSYTTAGSFSGDDTQGLPWNLNTTLTGSRIWSWYNPVAITYSPTGEVQINKDYYTGATAKTVGGKQVVTITINPKAATVANFNGAYSNKLEPQWGAGPYTVSSYDPNSKKIVFTRNPKWWGRKGKLDKRIYLDYPNAQAQVNAYKNGQLDYTSVSTPEDLSEVKNVKGAQIRQGGSPFQYSLFLNGKSPILSDVAVRHAVLAAVDRKQIADIQFQGLDYSEPLRGSALYYGFQKGYQDNVAAVLKSGASEASKILEAAGWKKGSDGIRVKNGKPLTISYTIFSDTALDKATAASLAASEKKAGINLKITTLDASQWASTINGGKFDTVLSGNRSTDPFGSFNLSSTYGSKNAANITGVGSPALDKEISAVNAIPDPTKQVQQANQVERKALSLYGQLPLYSGPSTYSVKKGLANVGATLLYSPLPETIGYQK